MNRAFALIVTLAACGTDEGANDCVPGQSTACACASGDRGAQICGEQGRYGPCLCEGADRDVLQLDSQVSDSAADSSADSEVAGADTDLTTEVAEVTPDVSGPCPTAVITCDEGHEVIPQTTMHCAAVISGGDAQYSWQLHQPSDSSELIRPSAFNRDINFSVNVVGSYTLTLEVSSGGGSCAPVTYDIVVTAADAIHIELSWATPGDGDGSDGSGSDLDLHVLHPDASDYFDDVWDCYWGNPAPNWGGAGSLDDPRMGLEDHDGSGPETFDLDQPQSDTTYTAGVHYYWDPGVGPAHATVRVYIYGQLKLVSDDVALDDLDLWSVCTIDWPSGEVTAIGGATPSIRSDFIAPFDTEP